MDQKLFRYFYFFYFIFIYLFIYFGIMIKASIVRLRKSGEQKIDLILLLLNKFS